MYVYIKWNRNIHNHNGDILEKKNLSDLILFGTIQLLRFKKRTHANNIGAGRSSQR